MDVLKDGERWRDTQSGAIAIVEVGGAKKNGPLKIILDKGKIVTSYGSKLTGKFVRMD